MSNVIPRCQTPLPQDKHDHSAAIGQPICRSREYLAVDARDHDLPMTNGILMVALQIAAAELRGDPDVADIVCSALMSARAES